MAISASTSVAEYATSNLVASIPHKLTHGQEESLPRAWGVPEELERLGLMRAYTKKQADAILSCCGDYHKLAAVGKLSVWNRQVLCRKGGKAAAANDEVAAAIEEARRFEMLTVLKTLVVKFDEETDNARRAANAAGKIASLS